jgi:hypothetical protein
MFNENIKMLSHQYKTEWSSNAPRYFNQQYRPKYLNKIKCINWVE